MGWCEANKVDYLFGLARNQRLSKRIGAQMRQARALHQTTGKAARVFTGFAYIVCFRQGRVVEDTWFISWGLCRDDERVRGSG